LRGNRWEALGLVRRKVGRTGGVMWAFTYALEKKGEGALVEKLTGGSWAREPRQEATG